MLFVVASLACSGGDVIQPGDSDPTTTDSDAQPVDLDGDGFTSDVDCDDDDAAIHPDAVETCDEIDNDCDGQVDDGFDADGDGHLDQELCPHGTDCDDAIFSFNPDADDVPYNGVDEDCDGADLIDVDGDGHDSDKVGGDDCDDDDPATYPGAPETPYDGTDQDCDGADLLDADGDAHDSDAHGGDDCDDDDPTIHPGATDWMNDGVDADCDGADGAAIDIGDAPAWIVPSDTTAPSGLGSSIAVCDLDEDGLDDLVLGAPMASSYAGAVGIFYGSDAGSWSGELTLDDAGTLIAGSDTALLGIRVACGDVDGDGHDDLVLQEGEATYGPTYANFMAIVLFYGDGLGLAAEVALADADANLEHPLGVDWSPNLLASEMRLDDMDGDGDDDVLLIHGGEGTTAYDGEARYVVLPGAVYAGSGQLASYLSPVLIPTQATEFTGVLPLSDLDGNGLPDLALLAAGWDATGDLAHEGRLVHLGSGPGSGTASLVDMDHLSIEATISAQQFGHAAVEGDFDGDGLADLLVSSRGTSSTGDVDTGGLWLFLDAASTLVDVGIDPDDVADAWGPGPQAGAALGHLLQSPGDVNGDGCDDVLTSAPGVTFTIAGGAEATPLDPGQVLLLSGCALSGEISDWTTTALQVWDGDDAGFETGADALSADFDGDGQLDVAFSEPDWGDTYDGPTAIEAGRVVLFLSSAP